MLVRVLAPILSFTCEEVWQFMPEALRDAESVQLAGLADASTCPPRRPPSCARRTRSVLEVREVVTKALEEARNAKVIGKSQEAAVALTAPADGDGRA